MEKISYKLPTFEGPLDLLLHLISKNKLNIYDISISELLNQYMEHLDLMKENNMDVASEFLDMASRLVEINPMNFCRNMRRVKSSRKNFKDSFLNIRNAERLPKSLARLSALIIIVVIRLR